MKYRADLGGPEDRAALIELQESVGVGSGYASAEDFDHWFNEGPQGRATIPIVRDDEGTPIGAAWIFLFEATSGGRSFPCAHVANLHVHPRHQGTLAYAVLTRHLQRTVSQLAPIHISTGVSQQTFDRHYALNPDSVVRCDWLLQVLDPSALALAHRRVVGDPLKHTIATSAAFYAHRARRQPSAGELRIDESSRADALTHVRCDDPGPYPTPRRTPEWLVWRFGNLRRREYRVFVAHDASEAVGYAIVRPCSLDSLARAFLLDFWVHAASSHVVADALLARVSQDCREAGATALGTLKRRDPSQQRQLHRAGFRRNPLGRIGRLGTLWNVPLKVTVVAHRPDAVPEAAIRAGAWDVPLALHETY